MKPKVYIETTVVSYLTSRPSQDLILAAHQQITNQWWVQRQHDFDLYISQAVLDESGAGDAAMARRRLEVLKVLPLLETSQETIFLARDFIEKGPLPEKAVVDAIHIAVAVLNGMDYLLTWNCKHIANAAMRARIERICRLHGYEPVVICTPEELFEADYE